jgi:hypothetical protein
MFRRKKKTVAAPASSGNLTILSPTVRVEKGPLRKNERATPELLSDQRTASHYYEGVTVRWRDETGNLRPGQRRLHSEAEARAEVENPATPVTGYQITHAGRDALGKLIRIGEPMDYLDWRGEWGWYIYRLQPTMLDVRTGRPTTIKRHAQRDEDGKIVLEDRFIVQGCERDREHALARAQAFVGGTG